jgi:putative molybdopterin biosynthesis protein
MTRPARRALREAREARGLTQAGLAEAAGVSRQSLVAIESGRSEPSVGLALRLARVLERSVEQLFDEISMTTSVQAVPARALQPGSEGSRRYALAFLHDRWVAHPLPDHRPETMAQSADAVRLEPQRRSKGRRAPFAVELLRSPEEMRENVLLAGCAPALGLLAARLNRASGPGRFIWLPLSSREALRALAGGETHVAGVHLGASDGDNVQAVRAQAPGQPTCLVTLTRWETVVACRPRARRALQVSDLVRPGVRIAAREPGSGARALLERHLRSEGVAPGKRLRTALVATSHLEVARMIADGTADAGVTLGATAHALGLACTPLEVERFDLVLPTESLHDRRVGRLLDTLTHAGFRTEVESLGGHDPREAGTTVARLEPAED